LNAARVFSTFVVLHSGHIFSVEIGYFFALFFISFFLFRNRPKKKGKFLACPGRVSAETHRIVDPLLKLQQIFNLSTLFTLFTLFIFSFYMGKMAEILG